MRRYRPAVMQQRCVATVAVASTMLLIVVVMYVSSSASAPQPHRNIDSSADMVLLERARARMRMDLPPLGDGSERLTHMVMVPGHGIYKGTFVGSSYEDDANWALEPFQYGHGSPKIFLKHIKAALSIAMEDPSAVVIVSGGQTRRDSAARSEGQSYIDVALASGFRGAAELLQASPRRLYAEEYARDSYENLLFSIVRFFEVTGRFPDHITVVGFAYKARRFIDLHRVAVRWPLSRFHYRGIDDPGGTLSDAKTIAKVRDDMYMCGLGRSTRVQRNPNRRVAPYYLTAPSDVSALLVHCGPRLFGGPLPWDKDNV